jgi:hypothetical protein
MVGTLYTLPTLPKNYIFKTVATLIFKSKKWVTPALFNLGMAWGSLVMPIMAYKYGYTFLDFKREKPV